MSDSRASFTGRDEADDACWWADIGHASDVNRAGDGGWDGSCLLAVLGGSLSAKVRFLYSQEFDFDFRDPAHDTPTAPPSAQSIACSLGSARIFTFVVWLLQNGRRTRGMHSPCAPASLLPLTESSRSGGKAMLGRLRA